MKLVTFERGGEDGWGILIDHQRVVDLTGKLQDGSGRPIRSILDLLHDERGDAVIEAIRATAEKVEQVYSLSEARLRAPVLWPRKLLCLAGNYSEHNHEGGGEVPEKASMTPRVFMKPPTTTIIGQGDPIVIPRNGKWIDWECELAVVVGKRARFVTAAEAYNYVAGYTVMNDVSERELRVPEQRAPRPGGHLFYFPN